MEKKKEENKKYENLLIELEKLGLQTGEELERLERKSASYLFLEKILKSLEEDKIAFAILYYEMEEEEKEELRNDILSLLDSEEVVDDILQEIINLYYLKTEGLLDLEEIAPQKELAQEKLTILELTIKEYLKTKDSFREEEIKRLSQRLEQIVELGSSLEEEEREVEDIDFLEEVLEEIKLEEEEKMAVLEAIIKKNNAIYSQTLKKQEREETKEDETLRVETLLEVENLLRQKENRERIVRIMNGDYRKEINMENPSNEDLEKIEVSLSLAKENILGRLTKDKTLTPKKALENLLTEYDDSKKDIEKWMEELLGREAKSQLSEEESLQVIRKGLTFYEEHKSLLKNMTKEEEETLTHYIKTLYEDYTSREMMYKKKSYEEEEAVLKEATFEIGIIKELLEMLEEKDLLSKENLSKITRRIENILRAVNETLYAKRREKEKEVEAEEEKGHIFFLMGEEGISLLEEDINMDSSKKKISSSYYSEIKHQLDAIENRRETSLYSAQPVNDSLKYIKKHGVRYTTGLRTKIFFIPVGKEDAIITGATFIKGTDAYLKQQDSRIKIEEEKIEALKESLQEESSNKEAQIIAKTVKERLERSLAPRKTMKEELLEDMLEEITQPPAEEEEKKKK